MRRALRERGYIDGRTIAIEYRYSDGKLERAADLTAEMLRLNLDLIVVAGGDPWVRTAANITGLTSLITELGGKRLDLLKEAVPKLSRIALVYDPGSPSNLLEPERGSDRGAHTETYGATLGSPCCERVRQGIRYAQQRASRWTVCVPGSTYAH